MINEVKVVITAQRAPGTGYVIPYNGPAVPQLQHYLLPNGKIDRDSWVTYMVPLYIVEIAGGSRYKAIRFGLRNRGDGSIPKTRPCDTGLSHRRICKPTFRPNYRPHSFFGKGPFVAWQLLPGAGYLIHEGGDSTKNIVGGSTGCIEIVDDGWRPFCREIEAVGGAPSASIGAARKLTVVIEAASYPVAVLY